MWGGWEKRDVVMEKMERKETVKKERRERESMEKRPSDKG